MNALKLGENHKQILNFIRFQKKLSGAEIARLTGLQPSTIVYNLKFLSGLKIIEVGKIGNSTTKGGKRPTLWQLNQSYGTIIGLEILLNKIRTSVIDFSGTVVYQNEKSISKNTNGKNIGSVVSDLIESVIKQVKLRKETILGIGLAVPGLVNSNEGVVYYSTKLNMTNLDLKLLIEKKVHIPVMVMNDANAGALGFIWFPEHNENLPSNIVYLLINKEWKNIGSGIILNHQLYQGAHGTSGEIFTTLPGFSELIAEGIKRFGKDQWNPKNKTIELSDFIEGLKQNNKICSYVINCFSNAVVDSIISIVGLINPHLIVIGGDITEEKTIINDFIKPSVACKTKNLLSDRYVPEIMLSRFGKYSVCMGATAGILNNMFSMSSIHSE